MTVADLIYFSAEILKRLHESGIGTSDYKYLPIYQEYERMRQLGEKTTYIVAKLSSQHGMCERKVYKILRRFRQECHIGAASK